MDAYDLHFEIDHPNEKHGWIHCYLTFDGLTHKVWASGAMKPFHDLLDFLRSLTLQRLPARFFWDEEGYGLHFEAWPLGDPTTGDTPDFHLRIIHENNDFHLVGEMEDEDSRFLVNTYHVLWVDAHLNREAVVDVFLAALRDFVLYGKQPETWDISLDDLVAFDRLRASQIPPRSDITHAGAVDLIISRWQDDEEACGGQRLELRMWDMQLRSWRLDDTDAFWPQWFDLLEHALAGLPCEMSFINMFILRCNRDSVAEGSLNPAEIGPDWSTRIRATPLDHPRHIRLQIFETDDRYCDFLCVDEVIDSLQLARIFLTEFENLLKDGYRPYLDEDGQFFDLRELPVDRLKERIAQCS